MSQVDTLGKTCDSLVAHVLREVRKAEVHAIDSGIEGILDPHKGYSKAHSWTKGTPKAPALPRE